MEFKLRESEVVIKKLEKDWRIVLHGKKFEWSKAFLRFELLRDPILTNQRLVILENSEVEHEIPISSIELIERVSSLIGMPYVRIKLLDGKTFSLAFVLPSLGAIYKKFFGFGPAIIIKGRKIVDEWTKAIKQARNL